MKATLLFLSGALWIASMDCRSASDDAGQAPPAAADIARGRQLFMQHCALCHGEAGDGRGIRRTLVGRPANFTSPAWRATATPGGVYRTITEGKAGTSMPAFRSLEEDQAWDLTAYVLSIQGPDP